MIKIKSSNRSTEMKWNLWWLQIFRDSFSTSTKIESPKTQNILQIVKHSFALVLGSCNHRLPANSYHKILSFHGINEFHGINSTLSSMVCLYFYCLLYNVYLFIIQEKRGWVHSDNVFLIISLSTLPTVAKIPI